MPVALKINGEEIDDTVVEEEFDAIKDHHEALGEVVCCDRDEEFRGRAKSNVINRTLLRQESRKRFGEPTGEEIDEAVTQLKHDHGGEEKFYQNVGMTPEQDGEIREKVGTTLSVDRILREHVGDDPEPDEAELQKFYEDHLAEYMTAEEVNVWHVYLEPTGPEDADEKFALLRKTRQQLLGGEDFETVAKKLCRPDHQIDLGYFKRGGLGIQEVEILTFSMNVGEISPVMPTHFGFHIFKLNDRKEPEPVPFAEVRDQILERIASEHRESRINGLIEELKSSSEIEDLAPTEEHEPELAGV